MEKIANTDKEVFVFERENKSYNRIITNKRAVQLYAPVYRKREDRHLYLVAERYAFKGNIQERYKVLSGKIGNAGKGVLLAVLSP